MILTGIALIGWLLVTQPEILFQKDNGAGAPAQLATLEVPTVQPGTTSTMGSGSPKSPVGGSGSAATPESASSASKSPSRPQASVTAHPSTRPAHETVQPAPNGTRPGTVRPEALPKPAPVVITPPAVVSPSPREHEKLASGLLEEGKPTEASQAFDNLVRNNPLYEPRRTDLTPEATSAFRKSQRTVLPAKAQDNYERGKAALSGGDYDTAMRLAREALAVIERHPDGMPPALRDRVEDLIDETKVTAASATEVIYSEADTDVRPPVQLSRTLPVNDPVGIPPSRVGWLDMVIGKDGTVFQVKLHTPLNRHHERMIVSAAKAFLFRPASRNGKPVMYRIKLRVTLPESGTDY